MGNNERLRERPVHFWRGRLVERQVADVRRNTDDLDGLGARTADAHHPFADGRG
jgi:hypothetical protein